MGILDRVRERDISTVSALVRAHDAAKAEAIHPSAETGRALVSALRIALAEVEREVSELNRVKRELREKVADAEHYSIRHDG